MNLSKRTTQFINHFNELAPGYREYRKKYAYYWNDFQNYFNYFIHDEDTVLEIGCAVGDSLNALKGKRKVGIDVSKAMIEIAKTSHPNLEFYEMPAENIVLDEKFDVIILSNLIGYLDNISDVLISIKKLCHPQTKIFISYYNQLWEPFLSFGEKLGIKKKSPIQNWLSEHDIANLLYLAGFETYRTNRRILLPIYIPVISWLLNKYIGRLPLINKLCLNKFLFARNVEIERDLNKSVTIVIPARNESGNIENAITRLPKFGSFQEIIFVEGNSTDDTWEKILEIKNKYADTHKIVAVQQDGKGKGDAVRKGYSIASGDVLMILDADLTVPPEELPKFFDALVSGKGDFINGSRLIYPMEKNAMRFLNTLGNKFFSKMFSWLLEQPIKDTLCGTKVMFREDYNRLIANRKFFGEFDPFGDFDLLFGAYKLNLKIIDLPIRYRERVYGDTNISRFKHGLLLLRMCWYAAGKIKFW